jgi:hypothetical protein
MRWGRARPSSRDACAYLLPMWLLASVACQTVSPPTGEPPTTHPPCEPACRAGPCAASLTECPLAGCAEPGTPAALSDQRKRAMPWAAAPSVPIRFSTLHRLQEEAEARVPEGAELTAAQWALLHDLDVGGRTLSEGDVARLAGWLVGIYPAWSATLPAGEGTNCCLPGTDDNDFHLALVARPPEGDPRDPVLHYQSAVAEMIPQHRVAGWTLEALQRLVDEKREVMVVGPLFYDAHHHVHASPTDDVEGCGDPRRFTLWEVHPVRDFYTCGRAEGCRVEDWAGWVPFR